jgi:hypothetical protein
MLLDAGFAAPDLHTSSVAWPVGRVSLVTHIRFRSREHRFQSGCDKAEGLEGNIADRG